MAEIRIFYNGLEAITTAQFAEKYFPKTHDNELNMTAARKALTRLKVSPLPEPLDARTKLWPAETVDKAMSKRPGKGANLRCAAGKHQPNTDPAAADDTGDRACSYCGAIINADTTTPTP